jgi:hypothetical protein
MNYKTNRQNHDFQIVYFLAGSCHTPDAAWSLLHDLRDDRALALATSEAGALRTAAKVIRAQKRANSEDEAEALEGKADLVEVEAFQELTNRNVAAARAELTTIDKCIAALEPLRKYRSLSDADAHQAAQADEWRESLLFAAQNYLTTSGSIPADHFATMRMHPQFEEMLPIVDSFNKQLSDARASGKLSGVKMLIEKPKFSMPALLTSE